jgi:uncharacterized membrane protein
MEDRHDAQFLAQAERVMTAARSVRLGTLMRAWIAAILIAAAAVSTPAWSHKGEKHEQAQKAQQARQAAGDSAAPGAPGGTAGTQDMSDMMEGMEMDMDRSSMSFFERLYSWFGRLHPMIVHFPIAFFPAALFTAIVGRRRPAFAAPVQFLVVAGGIFAPIAAAAGWFAGMGADPDPVLSYHRWLGVAVGVVGAALGVWAWRRPWEDRGAGMILALTLMTVAIAVQGFLGAGVTHGIDHMMF